MKKKAKPKQKQVKEETPIFTIGELDLILKIDFRDKDLEKKDKEKSENQENQENPQNQENPDDKYYKLEELTEIKSLSFLHKNEEVLKRFQVQSKNDILKLLLIGNQNMNKPTQIDYICMGMPKFEGEEEFFNDVLDSITKKMGITLNKKPLKETYRYCIKIEMSHKGKQQEIIIGSEGADEHEDDNEIRDEGASVPVETEDDNNEEDVEDYEETEAMKKKLIPRFKRKNVLCNLYPQFSKYSMIYLNFEDLSKIPGKFSLSDLYELLFFFKKKGSTIFINYYQQEEYVEENDKKNDKKNDKNKKNKKNKKKQEKENQEEGDENNENQENNEKQDNNNDNNNGEEGPSEEMQELNRLYYITDIYFFDKNQAIKTFDEHYKAFTTDKSKKVINSRNVYDYFVKGIATGTTEEVQSDKTGLFLEEFNKFVIIQVSKKSVNKQEYDSQPFPKINTHNMEEVKLYKKKIKENKNDFYNCFLSNMVTSMGGSAPKCVRPEVIYPAFLTGMDLVKKKIELAKNDITIEEDENFYKIKKHPKVLEKELEKLAKGEKEGKFLLDCTNLITSNKKEYVSLYDYHLKNFFSSEAIRKDLQNKGFIDSEGYIMYDPVYRSVMGTNNTNKKKFTDKEMEEKIITNIKDIKIHSRLEDKEIVSEKAAFNENVPTQVKIPFIKEKPKQKKRKNKKEGSSAEGSSNSGGSSDEEKENKSGE